jgi:Dipeptidyl aminopeptidases/acylaminoacyl-peptidases
MRKTLLFACLCLALTLLYGNLSAQKKNFSYEQLFKGKPMPVAKSLPDVRGWVDDENYLEFRGGQSNNDGEWYAVNAKSGKATKYTGKIPASAEARRFRGNAPGMTTSSVKDAVNPTASPDGKWLAYTKKDNNLYVMDTVTKKEIKLTNDGSDVILNGYASWVYFEEILGRGTRYRAFWWSPDSKSLCFMRFDDSKVPVFPIYVIKDQHGYLENTHYPKAGDPNPEVKIGVASISDGNIVWADFDPKTDQYFGAPIWTPDNRLIIQWMNRGQDNLKLYAVDLKTGDKKELYDETQKAWIDLDEANRLSFLADGKRFILKSDKDGWENLYLHDENGKLINQITTGNFWGTNVVRVNEKTKQVYFRARKENSARFDFYRVGLDGKGLTRLSFGEYSHDQINLSPNEKYFITTYSNLSTPTTMALVDAKGKLIRELGNSKGEAFDEYNIPKSEMVRVKSSDGLFDLPMTITYPVNFDPNKKYPVLVSVYGGPNAGRVYDRWSTPGGINAWWAIEGVIQVSMDNRSSGHFGKKGLDFIHRQMGKWEIEDFMTCGKWLRQQPWVDTSKVAITGGSFGGYMTCMALTYGADVFTHGVANASVTDWHFYDTHYTERFMDTPKENPEGYKLTSVMNWAHQYRGLLRIVHGTSDDNVHMQNSLTLIDKLQNMGKHFEFMLYPGERHGVGGANPAKGLHNRTEAYQFYYEKLLNKPMPEEFRQPQAQRGF